MADDLDLGEEKTSSKKFLFGIIGGVLLILVTVGATLYFTGFFRSDGDNQQQGEVATQEDLQPAAPALYVNLDPAFIVNFQKTKAARLLQVSVSVLSYKQEVIDAIEKHKPMIRNSILLLLSAQDSAELKKVEAKQALRGKILEIVRDTVEGREGVSGVEEVFFTGLVMQ